MNLKIKIVIVGIGGVGGYFGGLLAQKYQDSDEVAVIFVARGEHLKQIQKNGLKVIKGSDEFIAKPALATDNANDIGIADFIIFCTKSYDLEAAIAQLKPCIGEKTSLLPLLNGVDAVERIKKSLPNASVFQACVYIVSELKKAGVIENRGNIQTLYFGLEQEINDQLLPFEKLLKDAHIEASCSNNILSIVWEKFIFISATATATAYFDTCIGELLKENPTVVLKLIDEVTQIALAKGIKIDPQIAQKTLDKLKKLPYETTTSMHRDYKNLNSQTEVMSLTGFVVTHGQALNIETPVYKKMYKKLWRIKVNIL
jgi:2-dehydropantoate 2-reductase